MHKDLLHILKDIGKCRIYKAKLTDIYNFEYNIVIIIGAINYKKLVNIVSTTWDFRSIHQVPMDFPHNGCLARNFSQIAILKANINSDIKKKYKIEERHRNRPY